jgi:hypothetical protein
MMFFQAFILPAVLVVKFVRSLFTNHPAEPQPQRYPGVPTQPHPGGPGQAQPYQAGSAQPQASPAGPTQPGPTQLS